MQCHAVKIFCKTVYLDPINILNSSSRYFENKVIHTSTFYSKDNRRIILSEVLAIGNSIQYIRHLHP
jgi:hypothetical protein